MRNIIRTPLFITTSAISLLLLIAGVIVVVDRGTAHASSSSAVPFVSYIAPSNPEMSYSAIADTAVHYAREWGNDGEIAGELARGTLAQTRALMEGESLAAAKARDEQLKSTASSQTFCFGGQNSNCTAAEQQYAKETLYRVDEASTYLVVMSSSSNFTPVEKLRRGAKPVIGEKVVLIIDAHTGMRLGMAIGANVPIPSLGELSEAHSFVAASQSTTAQMASVRYARGSRHTHSHPAYKYGSVVGTLNRKGEVVVVAGNHLAARAKVRHGRFRIARIFIGTYSIAGLVSGRHCPAKGITVRGHRKTTVHLTC
jgi:hypothetical protein